MDERRELVAYLAREYGFQFLERKELEELRVKGILEREETVLLEESLAGIWAGEEMFMVSPEGWAFPVRDAISDIVSAAERMLQGRNMSFLAELDDGETLDLISMVREEMMQRQYYPYPTVSRGDRELADMVFHLAVQCDRPEEVKLEAQQFHDYVENVDAFGNALRDVYGSPFWLAVTLEEGDPLSGSVPRMAVWAMDDLHASELGIEGDFSVHFPDKVGFTFDGTDVGLVVALTDALENLKDGISVSVTGELDASDCLAQVQGVFRRETERIIKGFRENYFEDRNAGEWRQRILGTDVAEIVDYIGKSDARSRMGILKEVYKRYTSGEEFGIPKEGNLRALCEIGKAFEADSHRGVAKLAKSIREAAERGLLALQEHERDRGVQKPEEKQLPDRAKERARDKGKDF